MPDQLHESPRPSPPTPVSRDDLPPRDTKRWVFRRKAVIVRAIWQGLITSDEACERYHLSEEELKSWERLIERHGPLGLRVTRLQDYR